jgi:hypothetical protein
MTGLPGQTPNQTAGRDGPTLSDAAVAAAVEHALAQARKEDVAPKAVIGNSPAVDQPGRAAMSRRATDASVMMIAGGFLGVCLGGAVSAVLYFSGKADPTVVGLIVAAPPVTFFSVGGVVKKIKRLVPDEHHHHYKGAVYQDNRVDHSSHESKTIGINAKTHN